MRAARTPVLIPLTFAALGLAALAAARDFPMIGPEADVVGCSSCDTRNQNLARTRVALDVETAP
jgi:hypothetical protein